MNKREIRMRFNLETILGCYANLQKYDRLPYHNLDKDNPQATNIHLTLEAYSCLNHAFPPIFREPVNMANE